MKKNKKRIKEKKPEIRPLGDVTTDMEPLLMEMGINHKLQRHEIIGIVDAYLTAHLPSTREHYTDGTQSILYIGHHEGF